VPTQAPFRDDWGGGPNPTPLAVDFMYGRDAFSFDFMQNPPGNPTQERNETLIDKCVVHAHLVVVLTRAHTHTHTHTYTLTHSLTCVLTRTYACTHTVERRFVPEVKRGDVLTFNAWYNNSDAMFVKAVYDKARSSPPPLPPPQ
jgi:hypothetical protein